MQKVYQTSELNEADLIRSILESNGIPTVMRNDLLPGSPMRLAYTAWPEVWVLDEADVERARELIANQVTDEILPDWTCDGCGECIEGTFDAYWKCGESREVIDTAI